VKKDVGEEDNSDFDDMLQNKVKVRELLLNGYKLYKNDVNTFLNTPYHFSR
jgi:hypothetical protein